MDDAIVSNPTQNIIKQNGESNNMNQYKSHIGPLRLYWHYISIIVRSSMQYKVSFCMFVVGQFLVSFNVFLGVYFMFQRFHTVKGFTYQEVVLCFSIVLLEFSLAEMYARGFDRFPSMVRQGDFDRILLRPRGAVLQVLGSRFELTRIGRMLQSVIMFLYAVGSGEIQWTADKVITVVLMLAGGSALFTAMFMIGAAFSFFTTEGLEFMNVFTDGAREYGKYPFSVYGKRFLWITTFLIPYGLVQYYPLLYLLGRTANPISIFLPLLAALFLIPAYLFWRVGVRHYKSTGS